MAAPASTSTAPQRLKRPTAASTSTITYIPAGLDRMYICLMYICLELKRVEAMMKHEPWMFNGSYLADDCQADIL